MPFSRGKKPTSSKIPKLHPKGLENQDGPQTKRSSSSPQGAPKKRTAFVDITNAVSQCFLAPRFDSDDVRPAHKIELSNPIKKKDPVKKLQKKVSVLSKNEVNLKSVINSEEKLEELKNVELNIEKLEEPSSKAPIPPHLQPPEIPPEFDIDSEHLSDSTTYSGVRLKIFLTTSRAEEVGLVVSSLKICKLEEQNIKLNVNFFCLQENVCFTMLKRNNRADSWWTGCEVQAITESLQLMWFHCHGSSSKFEERAPPCLDDFLYICDDAYKRSQLIAMEISILQALNFDINIPVPYRFLRRYAKCVNAGMDTLTLARFICELSLLEMEFVPVRASLLASACVLIALVTKDLGGWTQCLQFHSGYSVEDLAPVVRKLHEMLISPPDSKLAVIRSKYAHKVFFEVALIPTVSLETLEGFLK
ncbi:hypothetical protein cypCar_00016081 [Cyprinus carpio]|nr:hypothetical protein cypCar_00016081 [Cyprinus carpio]